MIGMNILKKIVKPLSKLGIKDFPGVYPIFLGLYRLVRGNGTRIKEIEGIKIKFDVEDEGIAPSLQILGCYEPSETKLLKENLKPGMIFVDIGANIGYYSLLASKIVGNEKGQIYAFEPSPKNFSFLKENIKLNKLKNIEIFKKAISNKKGKTTFYVDKINSGNSSIKKTSKKNEKIEVETISLDKILKKVDIIKSDTQGAEALVLEGAEKIIKNNNLKILLEFWPSGLKQFGTNPIKFLEDLEKKYKLDVKVIDDKLGRTIKLSSDQILRKCGKNGFVNLFLIKQK